MNSQIPAIKVERFKPETSEANTHDGAKPIINNKGKVVKIPVMERTTILKMARETQITRYQPNLMLTKH